MGSPVAGTNTLLTFIKDVCALNESLEKSLQETEGAISEAQDTLARNAGDHNGVLRRLGDVLQKGRIYRRSVVEKCQSTTRKVLLEQGLLPVARDLHLLPDSKTVSHASNQTNRYQDSTDFCDDENPETTQAKLKALRKIGTYLRNQILIRQTVARGFAQSGQTVQASEASRAVEQLKHDLHIVLVEIEGLSRTGALVSNVGIKPKVENKRVAAIAKARTPKTKGKVACPKAAWSIHTPEKPPKATVNESPMFGLSPINGSPRAMGNLSTLGDSFILSPKEDIFKKLVRKIQEPSPASVPMEEDVDSPENISSMEKIPVSSNADEQDVKNINNPVSSPESVQQLSVTMTPAGVVAVDTPAIDVFGPGPNEAAASTVCTPHSVTSTAADSSVGDPRPNVRRALPLDVSVDESTPKSVSKRVGQVKSKETPRSSPSYMAPLKRNHSASKHDISPRRDSEAKATSSAKTSRPRGRSLGRPGAASTRKATNVASPATQRRKLRENLWNDESKEQSPSVERRAVRKSPNPKKSVSHVSKTPPRHSGVKVVTPAMKGQGGKKATLCPDQTPCTTVSTASNNVSSIELPVTNDTCNTGTFTDIVSVVEQSFDFTCVVTAQQTNEVSVSNEVSSPEHLETTNHPKVHEDDAELPSIIISSAEDDTANTTESTVIIGGDSPMTSNADSSLKSQEDLSKSKEEPATLEPSPTPAVTKKPDLAALGLRATPILGKPVLGGLAGLRRGPKAISGANPSAKLTPVNNKMGLRSSLKLGRGVKNVTTSAHQTHYQTQGSQKVPSSGRKISAVIQELGPDHFHNHFADSDSDNGLAGF